ncbi:MAG: hypothetical protein JWM19_868 [Actinomycetia bacterium]|nr:hypothetical protein [Actinomycetes bacterium]
MSGAFGANPGDSASIDEAAIAISGDVPRVMRQVAPYPGELAALVKALRYRRDRGWEVWLEDDLQRDKPGRHSGESRGMTLVVQRCGPDSYHPEKIIAVNHYFAVPPSTYNRQSWMWWLFKRLRSVDLHECMEDFVLAVGRLPDDADGPGGEDLERPLAPNHGPGWDPYLITVERTETDRRMSFRGELNPR